ncbi:hypothetical protein EBT16_01715 [bacterium]|nr:hypothetical protein [bacterium]
MKNLTDINLFGIAIIVLCLVAIIGLSTYALVAGESLAPVQTEINFLCEVAVLLVGYFWGSSRGSKEKTELLGGQRPPTT